MRLPLAAILATAVIVSGCARVSESRLNPFNWFGSSRAEAVTLTPEGGFGNPLDFRVPIQSVTELAVEPMPGGAIVRAAGVAPTQGWWDAELIAENDGRPVDGVLVYRFVVAEPREATRVSTERSRTVTAAAMLSDFDLAGVRTIVVRGAADQRSVSRR